MRKEIDLSLANYGVVKSLSYDLVVLPWGSAEPHNYHLPYITDCVLSQEVAVEAAQKALELYNIRCMVMPPVPFGSQNPGQWELDFCVHYRYETQKAILSDMVASLYRQGYRKMIVINGHGGNAFKNMVRDLAVDYPDFMLAISNWYDFIPEAGYFDMPGDHADEKETSVMMHYRPDLVDVADAEDGRSKVFASKMIGEKVAWLPRKWNKASRDTGVGDPRKSTAQKGAAYVKAVTDKYALLFKEMVEGAADEYLGDEF